MYYVLFLLSVVGHVYIFPTSTVVVGSLRPSHVCPAGLQLSNSIALVGTNDLATGDLIVSVGRPSDLVVRVVLDGQSSEAVAGAELAAPATGDSEGAAVRGAAGSLASRLALGGK